MDAGKIVMWVLFAVAGLFLVGGGFIVSQDPGEWTVLLVPLGIAALGVGLRFLIRKLDAAFERGFQAPPGVREVVVQSRSGTRRGGTWSQRQLIRVDEGASERDVARAREDWIRARLAARSDWTSGRVVEDDARSPGFERWSIVALTAFGLVFVALAVTTGEGFLGFIAVVIGAVVVAMIVRSIRVGMRQRRFGTALLVARTPFTLGARLSGTVLTGVPPQARARFRVVLACVYRWKETSGSGSDKETHSHSEVLWRAEAQSFGQARGDAPGTEVPVELDLPTDQPGTTLDGDSEGISWELKVTAPLPGIDFAATFTVPVLPADEIPADPAAAA